MGGLGVLRLLRLLRITRMAKLMRAIPEIMLIVKGLASATRAVAMTGILMALITYIFAIILTGAYHQGRIEDGDEPDNAMVNFGSMGKSVFSLIIMGAIFDDLTYCTDSIRESGNTVMLVVFILYMLFAGFTVLNMLIGILAEVVQATGDGEEKKAELDLLTESLGSIITKLDVNCDKKISKKEFQQMSKHPDLQDSLKGLNISSEEFDKFGDIVFSLEEDSSAKDAVEQSISYQELAHIVYKLRPGVQVGALDLACFEHGMNGMMNAIDVKFRKLKKIADVVASGSKPESVGSLLRSNTFNCPSPKSKLAYEPFAASPPPSGTATPNSLLSHDTEIADVNEIPGGVLRNAPGSTHTSRIKFFDDATQAAAGRATRAPTTVDDPVWRSLATTDIIREVERRLCADSSEAKRKRDASAAAHKVIATYGVPALPGEIPSPCVQGKGPKPGGAGQEPRAA